MHTGPALRLAMVAGEASGDLLAAHLLHGLRQRWPQLCAQGIGGSAMQAQGFEAWEPSDTLAVRGYAEVLPRLPGLLALRRRLGNTWLSGAQRPDVFIGVDAPDFNFALEQRLRAAGVPTVHFVSPSFWAWRADKLSRLKAAARHVLCVFPFEPALLAEHGIAATFVGHPLASAIAPAAAHDPAGDAARRTARAQLGLQPGDTVLALLPGSREAEVHYLGARFFAAAALLRKSCAGIKILVPAVPSRRQTLQAQAQASGLLDPAGGTSACQVVTGQSHAVLAACDVALVASGTATLEAALLRRPMVVAYRMHPLSWRLVRGKRLQPWVGLPNILCGSFVVPEFLQDAATPQALADALLAWLQQPARVQALQQRFAQLHQELARDTVQLATQVIADMLAEKNADS